MREGIDDAILAVVQFPAAVVGAVSVAFLKDAHGLSVDGLVADVVFRPAAVPFAGDEGLITGGIEGLRNDVLAQIKTARIVHARADGVASRLQTGARHAAHSGGIEALHADAGRREAVHVRRVNVHTTRISVVADVRPALVIGEDDENVWRGAAGEGERLRHRMRRAVRHGGGEAVASDRRGCAAESPVCAQRDSRGQRAARHIPGVTGSRAAGHCKHLRVSGAGQCVRERCCRADGQRLRDGVAAGVGQCRHGAAAVRDLDGVADHRA